MQLAKKLSTKYINNSKKNLLPPNSTKFFIKNPENQILTQINSEWYQDNIVSSSLHHLTLGMAEKMSLCIG